MTASPGRVVSRDQWRCTIEGITAPCSLVQDVIGAGAGSQCPNNACSGVSTDGTLVQYYAFAGGTSGYFNPGDISQGVTEWDGQIYNTENWQKYVNILRDQARWALAIQIANATGESVDYVYDRLVYSGTTGGNADFAPINNLDVSFLQEFPQSRAPGMPSIHLSDGLLHLDSASPFSFPPFGLFEHFIVDVALGHINPGVPMVHK